MSHLRSVNGQGILPVRWRNWGSFNLLPVAVLTFFDERTGVATVASGTSSSTLSSAAWIERFFVGRPWLSPLSDIAIAPVALRDEALGVMACVGCSAAGAGYRIWGVLVFAFFAETTVSSPSLANTMSRFLPLLLTEVVGVCMAWFGPSTVAGGSDGRAEAFFTLLGAGLPIQSC